MQFVTAIAITSDSDFVVSARARFDDRNDGGVWATVDGGHSFTRTLDRPVYDLMREPHSGALLAVRHAPHKPPAPVQQPPGEGPNHRHVTASL